MISSNQKSLESCNNKYLCDTSIRILSQGIGDSNLVVFCELKSNPRVSVQAAKSIIDQIAAFGQRLNTKQGGGRIDKEIKCRSCKVQKGRGWGRLLKLLKRANKMIKLRQLMLNHHHSGRVFYVVTMLVIEEGNKFKTAHILTKE